MKIASVHFWVMVVFVTCVCHNLQAQQQTVGNGLGVAEQFSEAGFELEKIEFHFEMPKFQDHRFAMIHFHQGLTRLNLKAKVFGKWRSDAKVHRKTEFDLAMNVRLWRVSSSFAFFQWEKSQKRKNEWKEKEWASRFWKKIRAKRVVEQHRLIAKIQLPKKIPSSKGVEISFGDRFFFPAAKKQRRQNSIYAFDIKPEKKVATNIKGWMITFQEPAFVVRAKRSRQLVRWLFEYQLVDAEQANYLQGLVHKIWLYDREAAIKRIEKRNNRNRNKKKRK